MITTNKVTIKSIEPFKVDEKWYLMLTIIAESYGELLESTFIIEFFNNYRNNIVSLEEVIEDHYHYLKGNLKLRKGFACKINDNTYDILDSEIVFKKVKLKED